MGAHHYKHLSIYLCSPVFNASGWQACLAEGRRPGNGVPAQGHGPRGAAYPPRLQARAVQELQVQKTCEFWL